MSTKSIPFIVLLGFLFGSTLVISRFSVGQFSPTTYVGLRLFLASWGFAFMYLFFPRRYPWPHDRQLWLRAGFLGIVGTAVPMTFIVSSLQYLSSGVASILLTTGPAITVILAHFFLADEKLTRGKSLGVILALAGTAVLALSGESGLPDISRANPLGYILMITGILFGNAAAVYIRKYLTHYSVTDVSAIRMFVASLLVVPLSLTFVGLDLSQVTQIGYAALLYAAVVGTFGGALLFVYNIQRFGATASAMSSYIIPVVAVILGVLFLGETVTAVMLVGMVLIIVGVAIINRTQRIPLSAEAMPLVPPRQKDGRAGGPLPRK